MRSPIITASECPLARTSALEGIQEDFSSLAQMTTHFEILAQSGYVAGESHQIAKDIYGRLDTDDEESGRAWSFFDEGTKFAGSLGPAGDTLTAGVLSA